MQGKFQPGPFPVIWWRMWWVYLLRCGDGTLYAGVTNDLEKRFQAHRRGRGARYTRGRGPLRLLWSASCGDKGEALRREHAVKRLSRREKLLLVRS
jgi:predicted GIY-YIG superfamily endonuclease